MKKASRELKKLYCAYKRLREAIFSQRWLRFATVGGIATLSYFALGLLFVRLIGMPVLIGNALAYALSFAVSYIGQSKWTFQASGSHLRMLPKFAAAQLAGLGLNTVIVGFCVLHGVSYLLSMLIATLAVPAIVYLLCKFWVFSKADKDV